MRGDDDDDAQGGSSGGSLAEGLGETVEPGVSSTSDAYGDVDDTYGSDSYTDGSDTTTDDSYADDSYGDESDTTTDDSYADDSYGDDSYSDDSYGDDGTAEDGTFGDGDGADDGTGVLDEPTTTDEGDPDVTVDESLDPGGLVTESESPLEGIRYVLDELHDALFGEDDADEATVGEAVGGGLETDPAELETDTDLDLNGDGVVDQADLHELTSGFDFDAG